MLLLIICCSFIMYNPLVSCLLIISDKRFCLVVLSSHQRYVLHAYTSIRWLWASFSSKGWEVRVELTAYPTRPETPYKTTKLPPPPWTTNILNYKKLIFVKIKFWFCFYRNSFVASSQGIPLNMSYFNVSCKIKLWKLKFGSMKIFPLIYSYYVSVKGL